MNIVKKGRARAAAAVRALLRKTIRRLLFDLPLIILIVLSLKVMWAISEKYERETTCLAQNIYREARSESREGQTWVGLVTLAMAQDSRWPRDVCGVVWEYKQFSWTLDENLHALPKDSREWRSIWRLAKTVYNNREILLATWSPCTRFYKRADNQGVSDRSKRYFANLTWQAQVGAHAFFCKKKIRRKKRKRRKRVARK